jgi:hypothetical protein
MADAEGELSERPGATRRWRAGPANGGMLPDTAINGLEASDSDLPGLEEQRRSFSNEEEHAATQCQGFWTVEPVMGGVADGLPAWLHGVAPFSLDGLAFTAWGFGLDRVAVGVRDRNARLRCLGNAVVPQVAQFIGERILEHERRGGA